MLNVVHRPFNILDNVQLNEEQLDRLRVIEEYDLWFIIERVRSKGIMAEHLTDQAVTEFKKYMALVALGYEELGMHSFEVDEIWHNFILFTREYGEFCDRACGHMIHHRPNTSRRPQLPRISVATFKDAYSTFFGTIPPIWQARNNDEILPGDCDVVQAPPPGKMLLQNDCDSANATDPGCRTQGQPDETTTTQCPTDPTPPPECSSGGTT